MRNNRINHKSKIHKSPLGDKLFLIGDRVINIRFDDAPICFVLGFDTDKMSNEVLLVTNKEVDFINNFELVQGIHLPLLK